MAAPYFGAFGADSLRSDNRFSLGTPPRCGATADSLRSDNRFSLGTPPRCGATADSLGPA
jgi:hypothetical protein